jgi:hypothetical protein
MPTFLYHETMTCFVTFVRRVTAETYDEAEEEAFDGGGDLLGVSVGDTIAAMEDCQLLADEPRNIPTHFYREPDDTHDRAMALIHEIAAHERDCNDEFGDVILDGTTDLFDRVCAVAAADEKRGDKG